MKKAFALIFALTLIMCIGLASASAGSSSDPLISKDYINGTYKDGVISEAESTISAELGSVYNSALEDLNDKISSQTGVKYAAGYDSVTVQSGKYLYVYTGGSVILNSGGLNASANGGTILNLTEGVEFGGSSLAINNRYFSAEDTIAIYTATSTSSCLVNGYYKISDSADIEDPTDPPEREFDSNTFIDVSEGDWYYDAIGFVYRNYIFNGIEENEFGVDIDISRADFVTVLYRMAGEPAVSGSSKFEDVQDSSIYYYKAVLWGSKNGIVYGTSDTEFDPETPVTREQMAAYMYRYAVYADMYEGVLDEDRYLTFPDHGDISDYAVEPLQWAIGNGIINGSDGLIDPQGNAERSHVAQIIYNFYSFGM